MLRCYKHVAGLGLFIGRGTSSAPTWIKTYVDGSRSKELRTPLFALLIPSGEVVLIHTPRTVFDEYLRPISEDEARSLDAALLERVARIEHGEEPQYHRTTKYHAYVQEAATSLVARQR